MKDRAEILCALLELRLKRNSRNETFMRSPPMTIEEEYKWHDEVQSRYNTEQDILSAAEEIGVNTETPERELARLVCKLYKKAAVSNETIEACIIDRRKFVKNMSLNTITSIKDWLRGLDVVSL
ncbi:MAG: hypothetical protein N2578_00725 [Bdellovibrionaceae bacterium]|nr:hypothetical protein [Pseudobdellovibrionaceae bacterium]